MENLGYVKQDGNKVEVNKKNKVAAEWWENIQGICIWKGGVKKTLSKLKLLQVNANQLKTDHSNRVSMN